jgi:hypothetical protein
MKVSFGFDYTKPVALVFFFISGIAKTQVIINGNSLVKLFANKGYALKGVFETWG